MWMNTARAAQDGIPLIKCVQGLRAALGVLFRYRNIGDINL